jgi:hypothetical protein
METTMRHKKLGLSLFAAGALMVSTAAIDAAEMSSKDIATRTVERRAVEAAICGIPAVNYDLMLQETLSKTHAKINQIVYWSRPLDWRNQTLTPNPDAIYLMTFTNTKDVGPVVIEIPSAEGGSINGNIVNAWQMPLEDAGPSGADQGKGGKYLVLPPGYKDKVPDGYIPLASDTYGGYALLRSNLLSHSDADIAKSVEYGEDQGLPALRGGEPARDGLHRREGRPLRFEDQI